MEQRAEPLTGIPADELSERRERLLEHVRRDGLSGYVLFGADAIQYFTGFWFLSNERPVIYAESLGGESAVFVPEFEVERTRAEAGFARIESYPEYPGTEHPMSIFARLLADLGIRNAIGADQDGYPGILGYKGPTLSDATGASVVPLGETIESMMAHKSASEIALIRESGRWCAHAHRLLQEFTRPGATETEASLRAGTETTLAMLEALGDRYGGGLSSSSGASAGYRGQIGLRSAWAHAVAHNIEFRAGDVLVSETSAPIWGYTAELERAMIIGPPTDEMRRLFDHTVAVQKVAIDAIRPGATCADVDDAVIAYLEQHDLLRYWRQHTGHGIGLRNHEAPFLDRGDHTTLEPGMVFTIEPGLYDPAIGGFRHSDTVVVTEFGVDVLTEYPSDIESLTLPVYEGAPAPRGQASSLASRLGAPSPRDPRFLPRSLWFEPAVDLRPVGAISEVWRRLFSCAFPGKIICVGVNYRDHAAEAVQELPSAPLLFGKFANTLVGPGEAIVLPAEPTHVDAEAELAVVIGRHAARIGRAEALEHVFGYTVANDVSARDVQFRDGQWFRGKGFDTFCPLLPDIVPADELDPGDLRVVQRLNGAILQDARTSDLVFDVSTLVSYISWSVTLEPGDVILTGTPSGTGFFRDPKVTLRPGDVVEVEVEQIGTLSNPVVSGEVE